MHNEVIRVASLFISERDLYIPIPMELFTNEKMDHETKRQFKDRVEHTNIAWRALLQSAVYLGVRQGHDIIIQEKTVLEAQRDLVARCRFHHERIRDATARDCQAKWKRKKEKKKWK